MAINILVIEPNAPQAQLFKTSLEEGNANKKAEDRVKVTRVSTAAEGLELLEHRGATYFEHVVITSRLHTPQEAQRVLLTKQARIEHRKPKHIPARVSH